MCLLITWKYLISLSKRKGYNCGPWVVQKGTKCLFLLYLKNMSQHFFPFKNQSEKVIALPFTLPGTYKQSGTNTYGLISKI